MDRGLEPGDVVAADLLDGGGAAGVLQVAAPGALDLAQGAGLVVGLGVVLQVAVPELGQGDGAAFLTPSLLQGVDAPVDLDQDLPGKLAGPGRR